VLREATGKREETVEFSKEEKVNVELVLMRLVKIHGKGIKDYLYDPKNGEVRSFLQFLVNGRNVSSSDGLNTRLKDGDVLAIIPPVSGG
jgi:MoaD family protein